MGFKPNTVLRDLWCHVEVTDARNVPTNINTSNKLNVWKLFHLQHLQVRDLQ